jgi:hypothetical protein
MAHYPPYTSKYNPIEHRLFCHVTSACKSTVFSSIDVVKSFVDKTHTSTGLKVFSNIKDKVYVKGSVKAGLLFPILAGLLFLTF